MSTGNSSAPSTRRRGRIATHDPESLLDLLATVAAAAVAAGAAASPASVSMPAFNRAAPDVDRARGVDPAGPERTPTAEAIQMRFKHVAGRTVAWKELVDGALRDGRQRTMWLSALRRGPVREDLTDAIVSHALRLVAVRRGATTLAQREYVQTRDELVADDSVRNGEDGILAWLLPTGNQVLVHCDYSWPGALKLAGLSAPARTQRGRKPTPPPQPAGAPLAQLVAIYAALNCRWPSQPVMQDFAKRCDVRLQALPPGGMTPVRDQAAALLRDAGLTPPDSPPGSLGKGKRLTYCYPVEPIPGMPRRSPRSGRARDDSGHVKRRLADEQQRVFAILSLRVWLAGLPTDARRVRSAYVTWQVGTTWTSAGVFDNGLGGFSALKQQAADANASVRAAGGDPLADALSQAAILRPEVPAARQPRRASEPEPASDRDDATVRPVSFTEVLRTVLAGRCDEAQAPKQ